MHIHPHKPRSNRLRSRYWDELRAAHLINNPRCTHCGSIDYLQVHHRTPIDIDPGRELDPTNLITLCEPPGPSGCHLSFGHLGNWHTFNPSLVTASPTAAPAQANQTQPVKDSILLEKGERPHQTTKSPHHSTTLGLASQNQTRVRYTRGLSLTPLCCRPSRLIRGAGHRMPSPASNHDH